MNACKNCGYELFPMDKVCDRCGTPVPVIAPISQASKVYKPATKQTKTSKSAPVSIGAKKGGMKCPSCGANIGNTNQCEYCGASISYNMKREREQLNKTGCPSCGSSNIQFNREKQGELQGKNAKAIVRSTVGVCKDCGYTWTTATNVEKPKKNNLVWWILGWIFLFPVPLTILIWRKKNTLPLPVKIILTVLLWGWILLMPATGSDKDEEDTSTTESVQVTEETFPVEEPVMEDVVEEEIEPVIEEDNDIDSTLQFIINLNEMGKYGFENTLNAGTEFEETKIMYHIPAGKYSVKNLGEFQGQISIYSDETHITDEGWEEPASTGDIVVVAPGDTAELSITDGYYVELNINGNVEFTQIESNASSSANLSDEGLKDELSDKEGLVWFGDVRNDATGKWRLSEYASADSLQSFASDYYKAYFTSDDEIHAVINMTTKVTGKVSKLMDDTLDVTLYEYVKGEEHDAKELFGGMLLKEYWVTISTGEVEEIP